MDCTIFLVEPARNRYLAEADGNLTQPVSEGEFNLRNGVRSSLMATGTNEMWMGDHAMPEWIARSTTDCILWSSGLTALTRRLLWTQSTPRSPGFCERLPQRSCRTAASAQNDGRHRE